MSVANKGEAFRCLDIAKKARAAGDLTRALKFAEKAKNLYPNDEVLFL
jgi:hypothetical protein